LFISINLTSFKTILGILPKPTKLELGLPVAPQAYFIWRAIGAWFFQENSYICGRKL
jgi:hypothetical protein